MARRSTSEIDAVRDVAAGWVLRLSDPECGEADRRAFAAWRDQSLEHELAYERERLTWARLDRLQALRPALKAPDADLLAPAEAKLREGPAASKPELMRWAAAASILMAAVIGGLTFGPFNGPAYATAVGERRVVVLPDHTRVELNTDSKILVLFHGRRRQIRLVRGEAVFEVTPGSSPFSVLANGAVVQALSAELDVRVDGATEAIVVRRGQAALDRAAAAPLQIAAETSINITKGRIAAHRISTDELNRDLAWRQDGIDLTGRTLQEAATEFNRYNNRHVLVADASISNFRLGGYFHNSDIDGFVRAVTITFPVAARVDASGEVLLSKRDNGLSSAAPS